MREAAVLVLSALIGSLPGLIALYAQRKQYEAEARKASANAAESDAKATDMLTDTALELLKPLRERIAELERRDIERLTQIEGQADRIKELEQKVERQSALIADVVGGAARLCKQVRNLGAQPVYDVPVYKSP